MDQFANVFLFLEQLTELTKQTGVIIETFGDPHYDPMLQEKGQTLTVWFSYDSTFESYIARIDNPYDGKQIRKDDFK